MAAFVGDRQLFGMEYVGKTESMSGETHFGASKDPKALLLKVCTRALDSNIAQLQHEYADFRIKTPLISTSPLMAYVGLKEDVTEESRFEVLERVMDDEGKVSYERVGVVKPVKGRICDNRFMAEEDETDANARRATEFEKVSGNEFFPGMLIREIK